jgi:Electron transfer DM13
MKLIRIASLTLVAAVATFGLVRAQTASPAAKTAITQTQASVETIQSFGRFVTSEAPTVGTAAVVRKTDGSLVLRLQAFKSEVGPDLRVWLHETKEAKKDSTAALKKGKYLELGALPAPFNGFYEFPIPANTDLGSYKSVVIWCDAVAIAMGIAPLN